MYHIGKADHEPVRKREEIAEEQPIGGQRREVDSKDPDNATES